MERITPNNIQELKANEVFVFGSNTMGIHGAGAARTARLKFGAQFAKGEGHYGQSYALPTCVAEKSGIRPFDKVSEMYQYVRRFLQYASSHKEYTFYVTLVGCGIAGFKVEDVAPMFRVALDMENVYLPKEFIEVLNKS